MGEAKPSIEKKGKSYKVQAVHRALDILDCFSFQDRELTFFEIVRRTGLNKSTALRLLHNLTARDFLQQDPKTKTYQLGLRLFELGGIIFSSFSLRKSASYHMSQLQHETDETVLLAVLMNDRLVYIDKRESRKTVRITSDIGLQRSPHYGVLGLVLMADLSSEKLKEILSKYPLEAYTPHSITNEDALSLRLEKIRKEGYAIERDEAIEGIMGIGTPIRDFSRKVIAALGVVLPAYNHSDEKQIKRLINLVKQAGDLVSSSLGYLKI